MKTTDLSRLRGKTARPQPTRLSPAPPTVPLPEEYDSRQAQRFLDRLFRISSNLTDPAIARIKSRVHGLVAKEIAAQPWGYYDPVTSEAYWVSESDWLVVCAPVVSPANGPQVVFDQTAFAGLDVGMQRDFHGREAQIAALLLDRKGGFKDEAEEFRNLAAYLFEGAILDRNQRWLTRPPDPR